MGVERNRRFFLLRPFLSSLCLASKNEMLSIPTYFPEVSSNEFREKYSELEHYACDVLNEKLQDALDTIEENFDFSLRNQNGFSEKEIRRIKQSIYLWSYSLIIEKKERTKRKEDRIESNEAFVLEDKYRKKSLQIQEGVKGFNHSLTSRVIVELL